jgi:hypothetical protein
MSVVPDRCDFCGTHQPETKLFHQNCPREECIRESEETHFEINHYISCCKKCFGQLKGNARLKCLNPECPTIITVSISHAGDR